MESKTASRVSPTKRAIKVSRDSPYKGVTEKTSKPSPEVKTRDLSLEEPRKNPETQKELIAAIEELRPIVEEKRERLKQLQQQNEEPKAETAEQ